MSGNKTTDLNLKNSEPVDLGLEALLQGTSGIAIEKVIEKIEEPIAPAGFTKPTLEEAFTDPKTKSIIVGSSKSRVLNSLILFVALIALSIASYFLAVEIFKNDPQIAVIPIETPESKVAFLLPELRQVSNVTNLGALFYDVQKNFEATPAPQVAATPIIQPQQATKKNGKERIDMSGPVEPREVRDRLAGKVQNFEPKELRIRPALPEAAEVPIDSGWYRVSGSGSIISEPGQVGRVMGRVAKGDEVFVEARFGSWVRLKSKSGRTGYLPVEILDSMPIERVGR